jgi:hypothetical protein
MSETLASILVIIGIALFFAAFIVWLKWFPATAAFRVAEKKKGTITFYRPEMLHIIFGWSPFWSSKYSGEITRSYDWDSHRSDALENIETYKQLKPIK